jgi:hypothetical protein
MVTAGDGDRPHLTKAYLSGGHSDDCISDTGANARSGAGQGLATERPSDETNRKQLDMARQEGKACFRSLLYMAHEVAHSGDQQRADDYIVAYAQGEAEGMYILRSEGELERVEPRDANCHLEISISDAGDRRFIPLLRVEVNPQIFEQRADRPLRDAVLVAPRPLSLRAQHPCSGGRAPHVAGSDRAADLHAPRQSQWASVCPYGRSRIQGHPHQGRP